MEKVMEQLWNLLPGFSGLGTGIIPILLAIVIFSGIYSALRLYRRCPADKILVISGRTGRDADGATRQARCIHGGGSIVWPIVQEYKFLSLKPITVDVDLKSALTKQNIRVNVPSSFTLGISTMQGVMENAAQRLLGLDPDDIKRIAEEIIIGQLRAVLATMTIEEVNADREGFMTKCTTAIGSELNKVGLQLINVNIKDIIDESGYIQALGQRAAAEAIQRARMEVAEQETSGSIGVAEAQKNQRTSVAVANAAAVEGENLSAVKIAESQAERATKEADAHKKAESAKRIAEADILKAAYKAEEEAELARASREKAELTARDIVGAEVAARSAVVAAEGEAQSTRERAKGDADAILVRREAEAKGAELLLLAQAKGFEALVAAAGGNAHVALGLLVQRQMPEIAKIYVDAVRGIKIDKVVVMGGAGGDAGVANHVQSLYRAVPGMREMMTTLGMDLPEWLASMAKVLDKPNGALGDPLPKAVASN